MADVQHSTLTGTDLHEPKGAAAASSGEAFIADGLGSGGFYPNPYLFGGYIGFDSSTPAYTHSVTTSDTVLNPTYTTAVSDGFTALTSPNSRLVYTGTPDIYAMLNLALSCSQTSGADKELEVVVYKNGSAESGSRILVTTETATWVTIPVLWNGSLSTNDYIEFFVQTDSAHTLNVANAYVMINGFVS